MFELPETRKVYISQYASPVGTLWLAAAEFGLVRIAFDGEEDEALEWVLRKFPAAKLIPGERTPYRLTRKADYEVRDW
jgi:O6-methylguanine-DNA--protein-cysteine methyltransferase